MVEGIFKYRIIRINFGPCTMENIDKNELNFMYDWHLHTTVRATRNC